MPFDGNGTFQRVRNWMQDAAANIRIRADRHDSEDDNFAQGLSQCITKDGQTTITANLPMANFRHTGVGAAVNSTDYARYDQVQTGKSVWADAGGSADAITASYSPSTTSPTDGQLYYVRASASNTTTTPTFSPDGQTARTIVKFGNDALAVGDIGGDGHELILRYRLSDTKYELLNPQGISTNGSNTFNGTNTFAGKVLYPDDGELTIVSGEITVTGGYHTVDTEGDAATDDLVTINGGADGQLLILRIENDARVVVLKSTGNIDLVADVTLSSTDSPIELIYDGALSKWLQRAATVAQGAKADTALQEYAPYLQIQHQETSGAGGGTATSGSWQTRTLNTVVKNSDTSIFGATPLSSNVVTLPAGTYKVYSVSQVYNVNYSQTRIRDVTNDITLCLSLPTRSDTSAFTNFMHVSGYFTLSGTANISVQTQVSRTQNTSGYGLPSSLDTEIYVDLIFEKVD